MFIDKDNVNFADLMLYKSLRSNSKKEEYVDCLVKLILSLIKT